MKSVEDMRQPLVVGHTYLVPCLEAEDFRTGGSRWWAVLTPGHEDSKYFGGDPLKSWHFHIDQRFHYVFEISFPTIPTVYDKKPTIRPMYCLQEMPYRPQVKPIVLGKEFINDFKDSKMKCSKCPHRHINLTTIPVRGGLITCPAHGLKFDAITGATVFPD